jgi:orotate phosphoribosyltransferase
MRIHSHKQLQRAQSIWAVLGGGILATALLYASLSSAGLSDDVSVLVAFVTLVSFFLVILVLAHKAGQHTVLMSRLTARFLSWIRGSKLDTWLALTTTFVSRVLTKYRISGNEYVGFEFRPEGIPTEHAGLLIYYVDLARFFNGSSYGELDAICEMMAEDIRVKQIAFDFVVGIPLVGSHVGVLLARRLGVPYAFMGKEREISDVKAPGDVVEGYTPQFHETALLFDDAIVSGKSISETADKLREVGIVVNHAYAFLDKQHGGTELLAQKAISVHSLLQGEQFAECLGTDGKLDANQVQAILREARMARAQRLGLN